MLLDEDALPRSSKAWGPSCPWPGAQEILGRSLPYDELVSAVAQRAPHVPVTNLGRVREIERGRGGELFLVMADPTDGTDGMVPVSRRNAPAVRRALDI